jgi:hypothetical protein
MSKKPSFKIGLNIGTFIAFLIMLGGIIMAGKGFVEEYAAHRIQTNNNTITVNALQGSVDILKQALPTEISKVDKELDSIQKSQAIIQTTVESNHTRLMEMEAKQIIIQTEIKDLDQRKLNGSSYWRGQEELKSRLVYVERKLSNLRGEK